MNHVDSLQSMPGHHIDIYAPDEEIGPLRSSDSRWISQYASESSHKVLYWLIISLLVIALAFTMRIALATPSVSLQTCANLVRYEDGSVVCQVGPTVQAGL